MDTRKLNFLLSALLVLSCLLAFPSPLDHKSMTDIDASLNRALQSFALARSLNAVISTAQGTEISVEPFGLGVTFTPGQVLDPVNDLIERFSWIMLASSASIGIQKIFLEISIHQAIRFILIAVFLTTLISVWITSTPRKLKYFFLKLSFILIFLRLSVPIIFILNELAYSQFLSSQFMQSTASIKQEEKELNHLSNEISHTEENVISNESGTLLEKFSNTFQIETKINAIKAKTRQFEKQIIQIADHISQSIVNLIAVFMIKTIIFPIAFLLGLYKTTALISQFRLQ